MILQSIAPDLLLSSVCDSLATLNIAVFFSPVYVKGTSFQTVPSLSKVLDGITNSLLGKQKKKKKILILVPTLSVVNQMKCFQVLNMYGSTAAPVKLSRHTTSAGFAR